MSASLPVVDDGTCLRSDENFSKITASSTFCVGDGTGRSPCNGELNEIFYKNKINVKYFTGDSGGAFAVRSEADSKYYFRGIVSSGIRSETRTCDNSKYAIFTDAAQYTDWIQHNIEIYGWTVLWLSAQKEQNEDPGFPTKMPCARIINPNFL